MYDASAIAAAQERPVFIDQRGHKHVGVIVGADTWLRLQAGLRVTKDDGTPDHAGIDRATRAIIDAFFPRRWWQILLLRPSAAYYVMQLPPKPRLDCLMDFMASQAKAMGEPAPGTPPTAGRSADVARLVPPTPGSSGDSTGRSPASTTGGEMAGQPPMEPSPTGSF